jgi:hypothetical protein
MKEPAGSVGRLQEGSVWSVVAPIWSSPQCQEEVHDHDRTTPAPVPTSDAGSRELVHHPPSLPSLPSLQSHSWGAMLPRLSLDQMTSADQARILPPCCTVTVESWVPIMPSYSPCPDLVVQLGFSRRRSAKFHLHVWESVQKVAGA